MTRWLLNSAVLPAGGYGIYRYTAATREDLAEYLRGPGVVSRIGYPETAALIERWTGVRPAVSTDPSPMELGDIAMVVRLRYRVALSDKGRTLAPPDDAWEIARLERVDALDEQTAALRRAARAPRSPVDDGARAWEARGQRLLRDDHDRELAEREIYRLRAGAEPRPWEWVSQWIVLRERTGRWEASRGLGSLMEPLYRGSCATMEGALVVAEREWRRWAEAAYPQRRAPMRDRPRVVSVTADENAWDAVDAGREMRWGDVERILRETPEPEPPATKDERRAAKRAAKRR